MVLFARAAAVVVGLGVVADVVPVELPFVADIAEFDSDSDLIGLDDRPNIAASNLAPIAVTAAMAATTVITVTTRKPQIPSPASWNQIGRASCRERVLR